MRIEDAYLSDEQIDDLPAYVAMVRRAVEHKLKDAQDSAEWHNLVFKPKSYIDQAGAHIEKLLNAAEKKKQERERATQHEDKMGKDTLQTEEGVGIDQAESHGDSEGHCQRPQSADSTP